MIDNMLPGFIITFREALEAALIIGILAAYIAKMGRKDLNRYLAAGIIAALIASAGVALIFKALYGGKFKGIFNLDMSKFFKYTSILLILFSAGMIAMGVHELNEAGIIPSVVEHVWDVNPPVNPDGSYPLLHDNGAVGGVLKSLIGYNGNPSLTEVIAYFGYWIIIGIFIYRTYMKHPEVKNGS